MEQDLQKAYALYQIAADAGALEAIRRCGDSCYDGRYQGVDCTKAYEYFSLCALFYDDAHCLCKLGDLYLKGHGVTPNAYFAFRLYQQALRRSQEHDEDPVCTANAQLRVGTCFFYGIGTYTDVEKSHVLALSLVNLYKRRKTDPCAIASIPSTRELLVQAQTALDQGASHFHRQGAYDPDHLPF